MERVGQHCAVRHKKDLGINVRKCDYCVQNDTHSGPDHLSLDTTLSGISLAPASSFSPRPLKKKHLGRGRELKHRVLLQQWRACTCVPLERITGNC